MSEELRYDPFPKRQPTNSNCAPCDTDNRPCALEL